MLKFQNLLFLFKIAFPCYVIHTCFSLKILKNYSFLWCFNLWKRTSIYFETFKKYFTLQSPVFRGVTFNPTFVLISICSQIAPLFVLSVAFTTTNFNNKHGSVCTECNMMGKCPGNEQVARLLALHCGVNRRINDASACG